MTRYLTVVATVIADTEGDAHRASEALARVCTGLALDGIPATVELGVEEMQDEPAETEEPA